MFTNASRLRRLITKVGVILLALLYTGCSSTKKLGPDTQWLKNQRIIIDNEVTKDPKITAQLSQKENSRVLGIPLKLWLYNSSGSRPTRFNNWLRTLGQPPVIYTEQAAALSEIRLENYFKRRGYLNVQIDRTVKSNRKQNKITTTFTVNPKEPYLIDSINLTSYNPRFDSIVGQNRKALPLKVDTILDLNTIDSDRVALVNLFRNIGMYGFQKSSLRYEIRGDTSEFSKTKKLSVSRVIDSLASATSYTFDNVNVFSEGASLGSELKTSSNGISFYSDKKLSFEPTIVAERITYKPGATYNDNLQRSTVDLLGDLNFFLYPNIELSSQSDSTLTANIYLRNRKRFALNTDLDLTHSNIQQLGTTLRSSILARNVFGTHENLSLALSGSIGNSLLPGDNLTTELGIDLNLNFPRWWFIIPVSDLISVKKHPQTTLQIGTNLQKNLGLDRQTFNASYRLNYRTEKKRYVIEFPSITYVNHLNPDAFFSIYRNTFERLDELAAPLRTNPLFSDYFEPTLPQSEASLSIPEGSNSFITDVLNESLPLDPTTVTEISRIDERRNRLVENNFIVSSSYSFLFQNSENRNYDHYGNWGFKLEMAGALLDWLGVENSQEGALSIPFAQYIKAEVSGVKHIKLSSDSSFATRLFGGIAVPFGSGSNVPFVRSYFAGGSNDIRAWNAYTLGPGTTNLINEFNDANFKITWSNELRFDLGSALEGALFTDIGNIWNVWDDTEVREAVFKGWSSLKDLAIGAGAGVRYDFDYFLFRLDLGWKIYNPALSGDQRWFYNQDKNRPIFNIGINYPF
jgi:outer membrane protein assembly factor BamA